MKFADMRNPDNEQIYGIESTYKNGVWEIHWVYPLIYDKIVLYKVPSGRKFSEKDALEGVYEWAEVQSPVSVWRGERDEDCCYYLFAWSDYEEALFRQEGNYAKPPVCVRYSIQMIEKVRESRRFWLFRREQVVERHMVCRIQADKRLEPGDVTYQVEKARVDFSLPLNLEPGVCMEFSLKQRITFHTAKANILLEEVSHL